MKKINNEKGFSLVEILTIVAIIAVLVGIAIPVLKTQIEKSREQADATNIRSAYAEIVTASLAHPSLDSSATVEKLQTVEGWSAKDIINDIAGIPVDKLNSDDPTIIKYDPESKTIAIDGFTVGGNKSATN